MMHPSQPAIPADRLAFLRRVPLCPPALPHSKEAVREPSFRTPNRLLPAADTKIRRWLCRDSTSLMLLQDHMGSYIRTDIASK